MSHQATIAAPVVKVIVDILQELNFSAANACRYVGINMNELELSHGRIPETQFFNLMTMVNNLCNRPSLAIEIGDRLLPSSTGIFGFCLMTAPTCREIAERLKKHQAFLSETFKVNLKKQSDHYEISFNTALSNTDCDYLIMDIILSNCIKSVRWLLGDGDINPIECLFTRPTPDNIEDYQDYFGCPLKFNASSNCVKLPLEALEKLNPSHNKEIDNHNSQELQRIIEASSQPGIAHRVREEIKALLPQGEITMDMVAKKYNFSERTLLRRLKEEGFTFQTLIDDTRKIVAKQLLEKTNSSLQEITFSLGFKDASTFYRAFKRWYQVTPTQYRKSCAATPEYSAESAIRSGSDNFHKSRRQS